MIYGNKNVEKPIRWGMVGGAGVKWVDACVESGNNDSAWVDIR